MSKTSRPSIGSVVSTIRGRPVVTELDTNGSNSRAASFGLSNLKLRPSQAYGATRSSCSSCMWIELSNVPLFPSLYSAGVFASAAAAALGSQRTASAMRCSRCSCGSTCATFSTGTGPRTVMISILSVESPIGPHFTQNRNNGFLLFTTIAMNNPSAMCNDHDKFVIFRLD